MANWWGGKSEDKQTSARESGHVYISYTQVDIDTAQFVTGELEGKGIKCWIAPRNISPGENYGDSIVTAINDSRAMVAVFSSSSTTSMHIRREIHYAFSHDVPIVLFRIEDVPPSGELEMFLAGSQYVNAFKTGKEAGVELLAQSLHNIFPNAVPGEPIQAEASIKEEDASKGYVFISYVRGDADFVQQLRKVFESKKYGYWDYVVGNRDYHGTLYRELEERIDGAAAFMTIVSDEWRKSDWVASEFIYAREAKVPIFVIQAKKLTRPLPILLNLQTRIDMSGDFECGAATLAQELSKKGL